MWHTKKKSFSNNSKPHLRKKKKNSRKKSRTQMLCVSENLKILLMDEIPNNHLGWDVWNPVINGKNYQPQLVSLPDFSHQQYHLQKKTLHKNKSEPQPENVGIQGATWRRRRWIFPESFLWSRGDFFSGFFRHLFRKRTSAGRTVAPRFFLNETRKTRPRELDLDMQVCLNASEWMSVQCTNEPMYTLELS